MHDTREVGFLVRMGRWWRMGFFVGGWRTVELDVPRIVPNSHLIVKTWLKNYLLLVIYIPN